MLGHDYEPVVDFVLLILQYSNFPISSNFLGILKPLSTLLKFSTQLNTTKFHIRHLYHPSLDLIWPLYILTFHDSSWIKVKEELGARKDLYYVKGLLLVPINLDTLKPRKQKMEAWSKAQQKNEKIKKIKKKRKQDLRCS